MRYRQVLRSLALDLDYGRVFFDPLSEAEFDDIDDIERSFGFSYCDINATLWVRGVTGVHANADVDIVVETARRDERWSDLLEVSSQHGFTILEWPRGQLEWDREKSVMFGLHFNLAIRDRVVLRGPLDEALGAARSSILDSGSIGATLAHLLHEGVYRLDLTDQPFVQSASPNLLDGIGDPAEELREPAEGPLLGLPLWTSLGVGVRREGDRDVGIVVISHPNEAAAMESAERYASMLQTGVNLMGEPFPDIYRLRSIRTEGSSVIAEVETVHDGSTWVAMRNPLSREMMPYAIGEDPLEE